MATGQDVQIHPTALVEPGAVIGAGTRIWHLAHVRGEARIGEGCILGRGVYVDSGVTIGSRVKVQNYVSLYHGLTVEDGVFIGPHACFTNDLYPRAVNPDRSLKTAEEWALVETRVCEGASIGANATILCGIVIGRWAMIGAGSVVIRNVPAHGLVVGNPARLIGYVCACGTRQPSLEAAQSCPACAALL